MIKIVIVGLNHGTVYWMDVSDASYYIQEIYKNKHRCTRVQNPGEGVPDVFCQNPQGGQGFQEKIAWGVPYFGFYCIFINKWFEICLRGVLHLPSPLPPPVCIYENKGSRMGHTKKIFKKKNCQPGNLSRCTHIQILNVLCS